MFLGTMPYIIPSPTDTPGMLWGTLAADNCRARIHSAYFLVSATQGFVANPGGSQGNLCLGGNIGRYSQNVMNTGSSGAFSLQIDLTDLPTNPPSQAMSGETWSFQAWFRDVNPTPTSNFTDGLAIEFP